MKTKVTIIITIILIIIAILEILKINKNIVASDKKMSELNTQISVLESTEQEYTDLISEKNNLVTETKTEILKTSKGSELTDLQTKKNELTIKIKKSLE